MKKFAHALVALLMVCVYAEAQEENPAEAVKNQGFVRRIPTEKKVFTPAEILPAGKYRLVTSVRMDPNSYPDQITVREWTITNEGDQACVSIAKKLIPFQFLENGGFIVSVPLEDHPGVEVFTAEAHENPANPDGPRIYLLGGRFSKFEHAGYRPVEGSFRLERSAD